MPESLPALGLGDGDARVLVRGVIDRVDTDGAGAAVVRDYKSGAGRAGHPAARWVADRQLQVALYLLVVRELTELDPVGGFYQPLRGDDLRARGMFVEGAQAGGCTVGNDARDRDEFAAALDVAGARAVALAAALRCGSGDAVPADVLARRLRVSGDLPQPMTALGTWTDEQRRAIERRDGDLLLDAGAGSGKTSVLVERFARAVTEDGVEVSAMLAITFTEKAAGELRDRIRARLRELGAVDQARATEGAFISTIHGFCARVLRAGALAVGLDPGFVVLDADRSDPLAIAAFDEALEDLASAGAGAVDLVADYGAGPLRAATLSIYAQLRSRGQRAPRLPAGPRAPGPEPRRELERAARAVAAELGAIVEPSAKVADALGRLDRCLALLGDDALWPTELDRVKLPANGAALSTDACAAYGEALSAYRAVCAARAAGPVRDRLDALLAAFGTRYEARKRAVSGVDFEDLELLTLELLRTSPELRERYAQRFERIMVDEFQDTNRGPARADRADRELEPVHGRRRPAVDLPLPARRRRAVRAPWRAARGARRARDAARQLPLAAGDPAGAERRVRDRARRALQAARRRARR